MKKVEVVKETGAVLLAGTDACQLYFKAIAKNLESIIGAFGALDIIVIDTKSRQEIAGARPVSLPAQGQALGRQMRE